MAIRAITFDCAKTVVAVDYDPVRFAVQCLAHTSIVPPPNAAATYGPLFLSHYATFLEANLRNDPEAGRQVYLSINRQWLAAMGLDPGRAEEIFLAGEQLAFGEDAEFFTAYPDAAPALGELKELGFRLAMVSNWDYTLPRVIEMLALEEYFEFVLASLVVGVEKPDPLLFQAALDRFGLPPDEVLHVGDLELDDRDGAIAAGMPWTLIDRDREPEFPKRIRSLSQVKEALSWPR